MQPKISVIVPVYNVEKYLDRCMKSLINQTYTNFEVILVDDGSKDSSGALCDKYAQEFNAVTVFHKENGGLSDARNFGLSKATGEYILFVDSDDCITFDALERLVDVLQRCADVDMVIGGAPFVVLEGKECEYDKINTEAPISEFTVIDGSTYLKNSIPAKEYRTPVWLKLYRREFLTDNAFTFEKGLLHEDELFTPLVMLKAKKVVECHMRFYFYFIRTGSITTGKNQIKNAVSVLEIVKSLEKIYADIEDKKLQHVLCNHSATIHYQALSKISKAEAIENGVLDYAILRKNSVSVKNMIRYVVVRINYNLLKKLTRVR